MLVITRHEGEEFDIIDTITGCSATVRVNTIKGDRARIGITAPARFKVLRSEHRAPTPAGAPNTPAPGESNGQET